MYSNSNNAASTQALNTLHDELKKENFEIEKKDQEFKKLSDEIDKKQQELKKLETDANGIKLHLDEMKRRRNDNEQKLIRTQQELTKMIAKDKLPKRTL